MATVKLLNSYFSKPVVFILGCTGTGKSKLGIEIAKAFNGEVINADAMQVLIEDRFKPIGSGLMYFLAYRPEVLVYQGLDIITNKVTEDEQQGVRHHLLGFVNPLKSLTVCEYRNLAFQAIKDIIDRNKLPIIVGGTFYYIESVLFDSTIGSPKFEENEDIERALEGSPPRKKLKFEEYDKLRDELNKLDNIELYERLKEVDPEYADRTHPNARRQILRGILVREQHGETLSSLLNKQRSQPGGCSRGGPLNFKNSILIWLQCDSEVLKKRLDDRVDDMLSRGLVEEMLEFHQLNAVQIPPEILALKGERKGIFQSIGFKEFYDYLTLDEEGRSSNEGKKAFENGVNLLKLVTKRYAKQQQKWMNNRFLKASERQLPPIYGFDVTDVSKWKESVYEPVENVVRSRLEGKTPSVEPMPVESMGEVNFKVTKCECGTYTVSKNQYEVHLKSKTHHRNMKKLMAEQKDEVPSEAIASNS